MAITSFDQYVKELEARSTPAELELLNAAREQAKSRLRSIEHAIEHREEVTAFEQRLSTEFPVAESFIHMQRSRLDHDGHCIDIQLDNGMRFTILLRRMEVWGEHPDGRRFTKEPVGVANKLDIIRYIRDCSK